MPFRMRGGGDSQSFVFPHPVSRCCYSVYPPCWFLNLDILFQTLHHLVRPFSPHLEHTLLACRCPTWFSVSANPKVLGSSSVACSDYFENLGFCNGNTTFICTRNKRVHFSGKSLYNLGRSWFKEGTIENDKDDEEEEPAGDIVGDAFKEVLEEIPVEQQDVDCLKSLPEPMCEEVSNDGGNGKEKQQDVDCLKTLPEPMCEVSKEGDMEKEKQQDVPCMKTLPEPMCEVSKEGDMEKEKQQDVDCMKTLPEPMCEVSKEGDMEKEKRDDNDADRLTIKEVLRDFGEEAKVQTRNDRKKGKMVQKQVRATSAPSRRKRKAPKMRSLKDIYNDDKSQMLEQLV